MADIYQTIWDADQEHAGVRAIRRGTEITGPLRAHGYVVVDEQVSDDPQHRVLHDVHIPQGKLASYRRVEKLFNNYTLDETKSETDFPDEHQEVQEFIRESYRTPPMEVAREYVSTQSGRTVSTEEWWSILQRVWFERFDHGSKRDLSGFEHVFVGEQEKGKVQGYHFWYKYFLDEHFRFEDEEIDLIRFLRWEGDPAEQSADVVTLKYEWRAYDYEAKAFRKLTKPIGGFWIGPSPEGLLALGTVRCLNEVAAPKKAEINGARYNLRLYRSPNDRNIRTFFPMFEAMLG